MQAWLQKGNRGVGFDHKAAQEKQAREQQRKGDEAAAKRRAEAAAQRDVGDERSRKLAKIVEDELKGGWGRRGGWVVHIASECCCSSPVPITQVII